MRAAFARGSLRRSLRRSLRLSHSSRLVPEACRKTFRKLRRQLAHLRFGIDLKRYSRLGNNILDQQNVVRGVATDHRAGEVAETARHNLRSIKVGCAFGARAPGAELIASLDVRKWSKFCRVKAR